MLSAAALALAAALLCWPFVAGRARLAAARCDAAPASLLSPRMPLPPWLSRHAVGLVIGAAGALGAVLAGAGGALAGAVVGGTVVLRRRASLTRRADAEAGTALVDALALLVAELRTGAHPADAAATAAAEHGDVHSGVSRTLAAAAAAARIGGDVPSVLRGGAPDPLRSPVHRLADAWALAERNGIPLADLLDTVRADVEQRVRFAAQAQARLAGPRATAAVLAGLPVLGLVLGQAMGAAPLRVLTTGAVGQLLLVVGSVLACAGVLWSGRLTERAARGVGRS